MNPRSSRRYVITSYSIHYTKLYDYVLRIASIPRLDLALGYEEYKYKDLFQTALNPVV